MPSVTQPIPFDEPLGTLVGSGSEFGLLRAVVAFDQEDLIPPLGTFLILEWGTPKQIIAVRLEKVDYTDYHTSASRREESLVVAYLQRLGKYGPGELTEEEKKALFFKELLLRILGRLDLASKTFQPSLRHLPPLTASLRYPKEEELHLLLSLGTQEEGPTAQPLAQIGHFALGTNEYPDFPVRFSPTRFEQRRTAVFAQTGYGKSNLTKLLIALAAWTSSSGILIFDLDGEYTLGNLDAAPGQEMYGLASIPALIPRLSVFSRRAAHLRQKRSELDIHPLMDLGEIEGHEIRHLMQILESDRKTIQNFSKGESFRKWLQALEQAYDQGKSGQNSKQVNDALNAMLNDFVDKQAYRGPLRRALRNLGFFHQPTGENVIHVIRNALGQGRVVIVDLSGWPMNMAWALAEVLASDILYNNLQAMTNPKKRQISVIAVIEEAQNVLNKQALDRGGVFVRWAKEGRKLGLGLIYITQQPGAIAEEIVSQTDNFFVMHLMAQTDTRTLIRANTMFEGVIEDFILHEPIKGNAYVYSAPNQPFVFPTRILHFTPQKVTQTLGVEGFEWARLASSLADLSQQPNINKAVGHLSHKAYDILQVQAQKARAQSRPFLWPRWVDHENKQLAFPQAQRILAYLALGRQTVSLHPNVIEDLQKRAGWFVPSPSPATEKKSPDA